MSSLAPGINNPASGIAFHSALVEITDQICVSCQMTNARIELLTDRQRGCLRLVARGHSSKEIAAELGISHHTVDLYLKRAIKTLGASSRRDAARALEMSEAQDNQELVTHSPDLAEPTPVLAISSPVRTELAPHFAVPFRRQGRQENDLTSIQRLGWICALALIIMFVVANFLNEVSALFLITK